MKYDIFISYRRTSYDTANLIATRLKAAGYSVFFDVETLRSGKFNKQLFGVIEQCKDFLLVLPPGALDRCVNEDDWVRLELMCAIKNKKNIIPILLNGFQWPDTMPSCMEELKDYQALTASSIEFFDMSMNRLQKQYLLSKTHRPFLKAVKVLCIIALSITMLIFTLWLVFLSLSRSVCEQYAFSIVKGASAVHVIAEQHQMVTKEWIEYANAVKYDAPQKIISLHRQNVSDAVLLANKNINSSWNMDAQPAFISTYHAFLMSLCGINILEVQEYPKYCDLYYQDYSNLLQTIEETLDGPNVFSVNYISARLSSEDHQFTAFYANVLAILSSFPFKSLDSFRTIQSEWIYFPDNVKIGEPRQYYDYISNNEMKLADEEIREYGAKLSIADAQLDEMQGQLDNMMESYEPKLEQLVKQLEEELEDAYSKMLENFSFEETDNQWTKWGKICRWGRFLSNLQETYRDADEGEYTLSIFVTPERVYENIEQLLETFSNQYPDSKDYIPSIMTFFREVSKGKRDYAGVLVFAFNGTDQHPFFKVGDIITHYNDVKLITLESLKSEYISSPNGTVTVDRLIDGHFKSVTGQMVEPDIVGFLDIVEPDDAQ